MRRSNSGSVVGFVIGAVLLFALLVGGIWLVKNNFAPLATGVNKSKEVAKEADKKAENPGANTSNTATTSNTANTSDAGTTNGANTAPATSAPRITTPADNTNIANNSNSNNSTAVRPSTSDMPTTAVLPKTGPADFALSVLGLAALVGAAVAYLRSHVAHYGSLL